MRPRNYRYLEWLASRFNIAINFLDMNPFNGKFLLLERKANVIKRHMGAAYVNCYPLTEKLFNPEWIGLLRRNQLADWLELSRMEGFVDIREDLGAKTVDDFFSVVIYLPSCPSKIITSQSPGPFIQALIEVIKARNEGRAVDQYRQSKEEQLHKLESEIMRKYAKMAEVVKRFETAITGVESDGYDNQDLDSSKKTNIKLRDNSGNN